MVLNIFPVTLEGENLGQRRRHYNSLVNTLYEEKVIFSDIKSFHEVSVLDHLFKIDAASKYRDVDYIINELKNENMIYASRAVKTWLLDAEYSEIINPVHLESKIYPEMITTAVTKLKHMIQLKLKDPERCEQFYRYYKNKNFDEAFKFLWRCSKEFILGEVCDVLDKVTPFRLKLLSETSPEVAKIFFERLYKTTESEDKVLSNYLADQKKYFENIKFLLKVDGDIFLDIAENCFNEHLFRRFDDKATKHIMRNFKDRFDKKPELYTAWLLDIPTLAQCLTPEEIKETVLKLARADYLKYWFSFQNLEPLIKRLSFQERSAFKKQVFVDKSFGDIVEKWPYEKPTPPERKSEERNIFDDSQHYPYEYEHLDRPVHFFGLKRKLKKSEQCAYMMSGDCGFLRKRKTSLDQMYDRFRFTGFDRVLFDLRKEMRAASMKHRQNMMLVLISKSGGRVENLKQLFKLLTDYKNEPENVRATVLRSLVRRCAAWRLPDIMWEMFMSFGRGLGLDGTPSTVACHEGLHAVIIRSILLDAPINSALMEALWNSNMEKYSLTGIEKEKIVSKLPLLILESGKKDPAGAVERALGFLALYKVDIHKHQEFSESFAAAAKNMATEQQRLLLFRLYDSRIARRQLFKENFAIKQTNASYLNALKHDPSVLVPGEQFEKLIKSNKLAHDRFLRKIALYFDEEDGLAKRYLSLIIKHVEELPNAKLARALVIISGGNFTELMLIDAPKKSKERRFAEQLKACCHLSIPLLDINALGWKIMGAKAIANRILTCPTKDIERHLNALLAEKNTQRLAFVLSKRIGKEAKTLAVISEKRPKLAVRIGILHSRKNKLDNAVWDVIIPTIPRLKSKHKINEKLREALSNVEVVPDDKKAEFCTAAFEVLRDETRYSAMPMLCNIELLLPEIDNTFIENVLIKFLDEEFKVDKFEDKNHSYILCADLRIRVIAKYLLLCKTEADQKSRWEKVGIQFFDRVEDLWKNLEKKSVVISFVEDFLAALKYNKVFLDTKYVCCLPMFELIVNRLQNILSLHEFYEIYVWLHLTMLYLKSVRQAIKNNRDIFENLPKNLTAATEIVGRIFGRLIAQEIIELTKTYFDSIRLAYRIELLKYMTVCFEYGQARNLFVSSIIKGILDCDNDKSHLLAENLVTEMNFDEKNREEMLEILKSSKNIEVRFFMHRKVNIFY